MNMDIYELMLYIPFVIMVWTLMADFLWIVVKNITEEVRWLFRRRE